MADEPSELDDVFAFLDDDAIHLPPIPSRDHPEGKRYDVPSPPAEIGMRLTALAEIARKRRAGLNVTEGDVARLHISDEEEPEFMAQVLGPTFEEMMADGVSWTRIQRTMQYAYIYFSMGKTAADNAARAGLFTGGKAFAPAIGAQEQTTIPPTP